MEICDSIGTPVDSHHINIQPFHTSINSTTIVVASMDSFVVWHYTVPRRSGIESYNKQTRNEDLHVYHLDDHRSQRNSESGGSAKRNKAPFDNICSVCVGNDFILIGCDSGTVHRK